MNQKYKEDFIASLVTLVSSYEYAEKIELAIKKEDNQSYMSELDNIDSISDFLDENYMKIYGNQVSEVNEVDNNSNLNQDQISVNNSNSNLSDSDLVQKFNDLTFSNDNKHTDLIKSFPNAQDVFISSGSLFKYDNSIDELITVSSKSDFGIYQVSPFKYYLAVLNNNNETLSMALMSQDINTMISNEENLIMWISNNEAYNFVFFEKGKLDNLRKVIAKTKYESGTLNKYETLAKEDQEWLENENVPDDTSMVSTANDIEMDMNDEYQESTSELKNKSTAQAYLHDRTFLVRDDNTIGVYKTDEEDVLTHLANLPAVTEYNDKQIDIKNANMFHSDTNMILLDKNNPNTAYQYDLAKGKVIDEWSAGAINNKNINISAVTHDNKFSQMTDSQLLTGVSNNSIFTMDARINNKNKVVATKSYKTNPNMNCIATTEFGGVVTGSKTGEVRLYGEIGKNAKNLLPCFGDPIRSVDTTANGRYVLATCDKYLIMIPTSCKVDKNGFTTQMGKEKPHPKTLKIKPIDISKYQLAKLNFNPAKFNIDQVNGETNIITSIGDYVVIWNFTKVKKGILDNYKIRKVNQNVIENQFKFNRNQIVVTMDNKLRIQNQRKMFDD